jgi:hypothetical protein
LHRQSAAAGCRRPFSCPLQRRTGMRHSFGAAGCGVGGPTEHAAGCTAAARAAAACLQLPVLHLRQHIQDLGLSVHHHPIRLSHVQLAPVVGVVAALQAAAACARRRGGRGRLGVCSAHTNSSPALGSI